MATFTVTTLADSVNASDGKLSLREALTLANANADADTITFAAALEGGTLKLTRGELAIEADVTIQGDPDSDGRGVTIDAQNDSRVIATHGKGTDATLIGLVVTHGHTQDGNGGGIYGADGVKLTLERCAVVNNFAADFDGGGIALAAGTLNVIGSTIASNIVELPADGPYDGGNGGGIEAGFNGRAQIRIVASTITGNYCEAGAYTYGGGIHIGDTSTLRLASSIVLGNRVGHYSGDDLLDDIAGRITASDGRNIIGVADGVAPAGDQSGVDASIVFASVDEFGRPGLVRLNGTWVAPLRDSADNPALAAADPSASGDLDQRGMPRGTPTGTLPDVGAFELAQSAFSTRPSSGDDRIVGTNGADAIEALAGNDKVLGLAGDDRIAGGRGNDALFGGSGNDRLNGGEGRDWFDGGPGDDRIDGDAGIDTLSYAGAVAGIRLGLATAGRQATGGSGTDTVLHVENLVGSRYADRLAGNSLANLLDGGMGDDRLWGVGGRDTLRGGEGDDKLSGGSDNDVLDGQKGFDIASYADVPGAVAIDLQTGTASGAAGADLLFSIEGVIGSAFADTLTGDAGDNLLVGGNGDDLIYGAGNEWYGNSGDKLTGGGGNDRFIYHDWTDSYGYSDSSDSHHDLITDFEGAGKPGGDRIDLSALLPGTLTFRGTHSITGVGQVRVTASGADTLVQIKVMGGDVPLMEIVVQDGAVTPEHWIAGDFIL